jgi:hypothetical protein
MYGKNKGNMEDKTRVGSVYYNRGVVYGIITVEAIRKAQEKYGKGKALTGEQIRWGFENLNLDDARLKALGATGFMPALKITCADHEGPGKVKFQQWDGNQWKVITDWVDSDRPLVRGMIEESAAAYAKEKGHQAPRLLQGKLIWGGDKPTAPPISQVRYSLCSSTAPFPPCDLGCSLRFLSTPGTGRLGFRDRTRSRVTWSRP